MLELSFSFSLFTKVNEYNLTKYIYTCILPYSNRATSSLYYNELTKLCTLKFLLILGSKKIRSGNVGIIYNLILEWSGIWNIKKKA